MSLGSAVPPCVDPDQSILGHDGGVSVLNRPELAQFLRTRRDRLRPADVGLPDGERRRTPGLRRQEVAQLAGMSVDYYIRLEQGRGPQPSKQVLAALARALMLTADEREYVYRIAGEAPPTVPGPSREVPAGVQQLLETLEDTPAYVMDAKYDLLAWNRLATYFIGDPSDFPQGDRNFIRWTFGRPATDMVWTDEAAVCFARGSVADLRAAMARYPGDPGIRDLVTELLGTSPRFAEMWAEHAVEVRRSMTKQIEHPLAGDLELDCQVLHIPDSDQRLVIYTAEPGSPTQEAFRKLRALDREQNPFADHLVTSRNPAT